MLDHHCTQALPLTRLTRRGALLACLVIAGCRSHAAALTLPSAELSIAYEAAPDRDVENDPQSDRAFIWTATLRALAAPPADCRAIAEVAAAIVHDDDEPFRGRSSLPTGTRWLDAAATAALQTSVGELDASRHQHLATIDLVAAPDLWTTLHCTAPDLPDVRLHVDDRMHITLLREATAHDGREELLLAGAATPSNGAAGCALFVPQSTPNQPHQGYLLELAPAGPAAAEPLAAARRSAMPTHEAATSADPRQHSWQVAITAIGARHRRPALLAVASDYGLSRLIDQLLAADERTLIAMGDALAHVDHNAKPLDWAIERALLRALLPRLERDDTTAAMRAAATRQLGAIAFDPGNLDRLLRVHASTDQFAQGLRDENLVALDARSTAVRVYATEWLAAHGVRVAGYDPLAERSSRRAALRRHLRQEAAR